MEVVLKILFLVLIKRIVLRLNKFVWRIINVWIHKEMEFVCITSFDLFSSWLGFYLGHHCRDDAGDTISCLTKVKPKLIFECLSPNQICDGHRNCLNNDDEESCGSFDCHSICQLLMKSFRNGKMCIGFMAMWKWSMY